MTSQPEQSDSRLTGYPKHVAEQMAKLAEVGAALCCYLPGAGDPAAWPVSRCDCKYLPSPVAGKHLTGENTGCCEVRAAYEALSRLRDRSSS